MKINEKNLAAYATSTTPIDREGWLLKRGELNKGFQKRWFILKGNLLFYFEKLGDKEPIGVIVLEGCTIELAEDEEQFIFKIVFHGAGNRSYILGAESQDSMEQWMKALACASYDYMKLMVAELQRQIDEMEELPCTVDNSSIQRVGVAREQKSPNPPPRQRHNPFNKTVASYEGKSYHIRSHSTRSAPGGVSWNDTTKNGEQSQSQRSRVTFRDVHSQYGRRVLADFNEWKRSKQLLVID